MKIGIIKPDYKIIGGFEIVVDRIVTGLEHYGHHVDIIKVDMTKPGYLIGNTEIPPNIYHQNEEFFRYSSSIQAFQSLELSQYDLILGTQPPSFAVKHDKVAILFYHHMKIYYDLYDVYNQCCADNKLLHKKSAETVKEIDSMFITKNKHYICGSKHIANRLKQYNNIDKNISMFAAGIDDDYYNYGGEIKFKDAICVGRHEFPKRPELFIHAMKHVRGLGGRVVGHGGKTEALQKVDKYLETIHQEGKEIEDNKLWKEIMFDIDNISEKINENINSNVTFTGRVSHEELIKEYANSLCVVCPAYEEDYGLTAIEAMAFGKPVIVCSDGGGYVEFIEEGKNGFVVEPTAIAIAEKISYLKDNPEILQQMSKYAYEFSRKYSWENAIKTLNDIISHI